MVKLLSPVEVWQGVELNDDLDVDVISEKIKNNCKYERVFFSGDKTEKGVVRIYGVFAYPLDLKTESGKLPVVLVVGDDGEDVDEELVDYFLSLDLAVLAIDTGGVGKSGLFTHYPEDLSYGNFDEAGKRMERVVETCRDTSQFLWVKDSRYALKFLRERANVDADNIGVVGIKRGAATAFQLATIEKISCAAAIFYAGYGTQKNDYKYDEADEKMMDSSVIAFIAGLSPQSYAPYINCPMLYLTASNDPLCNLDRAMDTMARLNGAVQSGVYITPNTSNTIGSRGTRDLRLFLNVHLKGVNIDFPSQPIADITEAGDNVMVDVVVDDPENVKRADCFFSQTGYVPSRRNWHYKELVRGAGSYLSDIDLIRGKQYVYAFVNIEYKNGFTLSSNLAVKRTDSFKNLKEPVKKNIIYNGLMGIDSFSGTARRVGTKAVEVFSDSYLTSVKTGANGIVGISSDKYLCTYKLSDEEYSGEDGDVLKFDLYSKTAQTAHMVLVENIGDEEINYSVDLPLAGGETWQNFELSVTDFKDSEKASLSSWQDVNLMILVSQDEIILNNMLWI